MNIKGRIAVEAAKKFAESKKKAPTRSKSEHKEAHGIAWMVRVGVLCGIAYALIQML